MRRAIFLPLILLPLAACDKGPGATISFNSSGEGGNAIVQADGATGRVAIDVPGFNGNFTLPKIQLDAKDFELNGVHLYPGSKIATMNIDAQTRIVGKDSGTVKVAFESPASPEKVRDWFQEKLTRAGFTLTQDGSGLTGTTDEKKPFHLSLSPAGADKAKGMIEVSG